MSKIRIADYPQLALLGWHLRQDAELEESEVFALYEREWRFIDVATLQADELALIDRLTQRYGGGVLNV